MKIIKVFLSISFAGICILFFSTSSYSMQAENTWISGNLYVQEQETKEARCERSRHEGFAVVDGVPVNSSYTGCEIRGNRFGFLYEGPVKRIGSPDIYHGAYAVKDTKFAYGWQYRKIVLDDSQSLWAAEGGDVLVETEYLEDQDKTKIYVYTDLDNALYPTLVTGGVYYEYGINRFAPGTKVYEVDHKISSLKVTPDAKYVFAKTYTPGSDFSDVVKIDTFYNNTEYIVNEQYYDEVNAITNDGRYMLFGRSIYDTQKCIDAPLDKNICQSRAIDEVVRAHYGAYIAFIDGRYAKFSEGGDSIELNASVVMPDYLGMGQLKTLNVSTYRLLDYLALGDSYSSGEGDMDKDSSGKTHYLALTDIDKDTCHVSSRSYPFLLRDYMNIHSDNMRSVACSGAQVTMDYNRSLHGYFGQGGRLRGTNDIEQAYKTALDKFIPGRIPQIEFVKKYKPKTITITGGGNDVGFADILAYCATPTWENLVFWVDSDCGYANKDSDLERMLYNSINTQYYSNKRLIEDLKLASPGTRIILVGYPSFVTDVSTTGCTLNSGTLTKSEIKMINKAVSDMNQMLQRVASDTEVSFVSIEDSLKGGRICEGSQYMTGVWSNVIGDASPSERFHPNAKGHQKIAETIISSRVLQQDSIPERGLFEVAIHYTTSIRMKLLDTDLVGGNGNTSLQVDAGVLAPNSQYNLTVYSSPTSLGTYSADGQGSVNQGVSFKSIPAGRHILMLRGTASSGEAVELYQFITINHLEDEIDEVKGSGDSLNMIKVGNISSSEVGIAGLGDNYSDFNNLTRDNSLGRQGTENIDSITVRKSKPEAPQTSTIHWIVMLAAVTCTIIVVIMKIWVAYQRRARSK